MNTAMTLPLDAVRVVDLSEGIGESCGRYLADLGAEVIRVEPPGGAASRRQEPVVEGTSIPFALRNANKLGITADLDDPAGRARLLDLVADADIVLESFAPEWAATRGLGPEQLIAHNPALVVVSVTPFGRTGPYRDWAGTEGVLAALGGVLSRSGLPGADPLLPPAGILDETAAVHAAWATLVAHVKRLRTGSGEHVDFSALEAIAHGFDPGFGTQGTAAAGRAKEFPRDRPDAKNFYPVFPCRDGYVRICILAKRQWRAMFEWLGEPEEFADPSYDAIPARFAAAGRLYPLIGRLFSDHTREELVAEGTKRGVPIAGVLTPGEVLEVEHFDVTGTFVDAEIAPGLTARIPSGYLEVGGVRAGFRHRAPQVGEHDGRLPDRVRSAPTTPCGLPELPEGRGPLHGLRVLDLGVIVFGAELSRLLADQGADVIKIENTAFPDGLRQSRRGGTHMPASFVWGHRNKRGLGLDLRSEEGAEIFRALVAQADIVLANFKPGTLESLGFSHAELESINPRIITSDSSAFGGVGPWSKRMGYGPLVRASCGVSTLWRYPDLEGEFCDGITVYPDHVAGYTAAVAVLAAVIGRWRSGLGTPITVSQADVAVSQLGVGFAAESLIPGSFTARGNAVPHEAPSGVYACAGDDEWCAISVRDDEDWSRLCTAIGQRELAEQGDLATASGRIERRKEVDQIVAEWTAQHCPREVMQILQGAGVPAGVMHRLPDELTDPQLVAREAFRPLVHEAFDEPLPANARVARFSTIPDPPLRPAPLSGEHTREICTTLLGMSSERIDELVRSGVLQPPSDDPALAGGQPTTDAASGRES